MHELDGSFKRAKAERARRRRQRTVRRVLVAAVLLVLVGLGGGVWWWLQVAVPGGVPADDPEQAVAEPEVPVYVPAIVDLAGDPMTISLGSGTGDGGRIKLLPRPADLPPDRALTQVALLSDVMISSSERFMTTLPSSPSDFAFYQAQRSAPISAQAQQEPEPVATVTSDEPVDLGTQDQIYAGGAGWGEELAADSDAVDSVAATAVENTTSVAVTRNEQSRFKPDTDLIVRILAPKPLSAFFAENGLPADAASVYAAALESSFEREGLLAGDIVAVRTIKVRGVETPRVVQLSLYTTEGYVGTLALDDDGNVAVGADPWVPDELFNYRGEEQVADPGRQYRLLDAIYSTAARNRVPTAVIGEAIMLLSRSFDLNAFASPDDRLVLSYAPDSEEGSAGQVLYAAISGTDRDIRCYVFRATSTEDYSCFTNEGRGGGTASGNGMTAPVNGVLTSKFGPRMHPIFKEIRVHTGVDWAAPSGTPVVAAFGGEIVHAGPGGGYGNLLKIGHGGGRETWYAHLSRFADGIVAGKVVKAGDLVGYVGTTGNSTGPHLHFELRVGGTPSDPLQANVLVADAGITSGEAAAVEALTDRIVQVESGGSATAKNPLSTATGAGQFIQSTWLRMMRTYRPDLAQTMTEAELLALRNDRTISREMVQNLAREGESYLKARGHAITAGRLYLAHFLGMEDAHRVLSADAAQSLEQLLGAGVINANPFLRGHDVAYVIDWAEGKMRGAGSAPTPAAPAAPVRSPEFDAYQVAINTMLDAATNPSSPPALAAAAML